MPIYEYRCSECGFQDEFLQKLSDPLMTVCPSCGKESLKKLLSAAGFQLKGSGWYATDFKGSGSKPAAASGSKPEAKAEGGDSAAKPSAESASSDSSKPATPKVAPAGTSG
jgi:putative FmdB family regulatory protein